MITPLIARVRLFATVPMLLILLASMLAPARSAAVPVTQADAFAAVDAYVEQVMAEQSLPGLQLAIVQGGEVAHVRAFGVADPNGRPMTNTTPMYIASVSKSITALAVMQLVEAGTLELDAPVRRYLPWFRVADPAATEQITIRQLMEMTDGIHPTYGRVKLADGYAGDDAIERYVRGMADAPQFSPPGKRMARPASTATLSTRPRSTAPPEAPRPECDSEVLVALIDAIAAVGVIPSACAVSGLAMAIWVARSASSRGISGWLSARGWTATTWARSSTIAVTLVFSG